MRQVICGLGAVLAVAPVAEAVTKYRYTELPIADAELRGISNNGMTIGYVGLSPSRRYFRTDGVSGLHWLAYEPLQVVDDSFEKSAFWIRTWNQVHHSRLGVYHNGYAFKAVNSNGEFTAVHGGPVAYLGDGAAAKIHQIPTLGGVTHGNYGPAAISEAGHVAGTLWAADGQAHAFVYHNGVTTDLGLGVGLDVNESGQVIGSNHEGFPNGGWLYDSRTKTTRSLGTGQFRPTDINRWGQVAVFGYDFSVGGLRPLYWERGRMSNLAAHVAGGNVPGFDLSSVTGINDRGQFSGFGYHTVNGQRGDVRAVILTPATGTSGFFPLTPNNADAATGAGRFTAAANGTWFALAGAAVGSPHSGGPAGQPASLAPSAPAGHATGTAEAYHYRLASDGSAFRSIDDIAYGFADPVSVWVGGLLLGTFEPGQPLRFADHATLLGDRLIGGGVREFTVTGVTPADRFEDYATFALQLTFTTPTADFDVFARNSLTGDADGDGKVGYSDFALLRNGFGGDAAAGWYGGDFDLDGLVGAADFGLLQRSFNMAMTSTQLAEVNAFAASVPEPGGAVAALAAASGLIVRRRRSRA